jgi:formylglycine-generating enzyme required for sulfatase activity
MQQNIPPQDPSTDEKELITPIKFEPVTGPIRQINLKFRLGSLAVIAGLLFSAAIAWYIVTGKSVYFETIPANAEIEILEGLYLKLADRYLLRERSYPVSVTAEGYHPLIRDLEISEERSQEFLLEMARLPGHLNIMTDPDIAAEIWVDDISYGITPTTINDIEYGKYALRLTSDRFFDFRTEIEIEGLDKEQSLLAKLTPAWGDINFISNPIGADIFIDDELIGQTPFTAEVLQGEHDIRVKLAGYKLWRKTLRVTANEAQTIDDIILDPANAVVQIITSPDKANITINGEYIGQSPVEAALSPDIAATVNAFKPGFRRTSRSVTLASGDNTTLRLTLEAETAQVKIIANPSDARVYIDGNASGLANQTLELSTVPHTILIRKDGYVEYETKVTPRPGIPQQVSVQLKTLEQARLDAIKPVIQTVAGQTLRMYEPTAVVMGASRREPGRRANEAIRNISWEQAALYCNWLSEQESLPPFYIVTDDKVSGFNPNSHGYRLPTEAEWAWATRVQGNNQQWKYPWGNDMPPKEGSGNYADISAAPIIGNVVQAYNDGYIVSAPVSSFSANIRGIYDLGGNVAEWVHDFYDIPLSSENTVTIDPLGPETGEYHVIRGSSWAHGTITELRLSFRDYGSDPRTDVGFRIARYIQ